MLAASRILVAIIGLLSLISVYQHWFDVASLADARGIETVGAIGAANIRADVGGLFLAIALFAFVAAWNIDDSEIIKLARAIGRKPGALGQITESLRLASILAAGAGRALTAADLREAWVNRGGEEMR